MYYKNTPLVPIPVNSEKGKIVVTGSGYVYLQTAYTWDAEKRQAHYDRKTIGKTDKEHPGQMYYSPEYESIFGPVESAPTVDESTPVEEVSAPAEEGESCSPRRHRHTKIQVIDAKIAALQEKKAGYQAKIDQIDKDIADLEAKKAERPLTLKDVRAAMKEAGLTEEEVISLIKEKQIGE